MSYTKRREQGDRYISHSNQVAMGIMVENNLLDVDFKNPTPKEDREFGIDQFISVSPISLAFRTREFSNKDYFLEGFTLRTSTYQGMASEFDKVKFGLYADYLLYGLADEEDSGLLQSAFLLDMKSVGAQLQAYPWLNDLAVRGPGFIALPYDDDFWVQPIIAGTWGLQKSKRNPPVINRTEEEKT